LLENDQEHFEAPNVRRVLYIALGLETKKWKTSFKIEMLSA